ncbi:hypothetical protein EDB85DRAFT_1888951 [Lactarius pseudohatsudake]|nr:hypothetical protein EDB85DRAFT_1888951 [Lactarius pseudohatsudake]
MRTGRRARMHPIPREYPCAYRAAYPRATPFHANGGRVVLLHAPSHVYGAAQPRGKGCRGWRANGEGWNQGWHALVIPARTGQHGQGGKGGGGGVPHVLGGVRREGGEGGGEGEEGSVAKGEGRGQGVACLVCPLSAHTGQQGKGGGGLVHPSTQMGKEGARGLRALTCPPSGWCGQVGRGGAGPCALVHPLSTHTNGVPRTGKRGAAACPCAPPFCANVVAQTGEKGGPGRLWGIVCPVSACKGGSGGQREGRKGGWATYLVRPSLRVMRGVGLPSCVPIQRKWGRRGEERRQEEEAGRGGGKGGGSNMCLPRQRFSNWVSIPYLSSLLLSTPITLPSPPQLPFALKDTRGRAPPYPASRATPFTCRQECTREGGMQGHAIPGPTLPHSCKRGTYKGTLLRMRGKSARKVTQPLAPPIPIALGPPSPLTSPPHTRRKGARQAAPSHGTLFAREGAHKAKPTPPPYVSHSGAGVFTAP